MKPLVFILFGPTASGKTALLQRLDKNIEIISADSMQVYRGMDIGTAKPTREERAKTPHHLIDIRNPDEQFNAGDFARLAEEACLAALARGALPVVSGGTGFYIKNLIMGLSEAPPSDQSLRLEQKKELALRGAPSLMEELAKADPVSAARVHINDEYRLLRALEVFRLTGRPLSSYASPWNLPSASFSDNSPFRFLLVGLRRSREELYRRINARAAAMFKAGLPAEVRRLYETGFTPENPGLRAIGYREFFVRDPGGAWRLSGDLAGLEALVAQNSRRYAKRQITFFASIPGVKWIDCAGDTMPDLGELINKSTTEGTEFHGGSQNFS
jgi:tRNA dimethylallyltransferase